MSTFGTRAPREETIGEMAFTCLQVSRDLGKFSTVIICQRVIAQLRTGQSPRLGDVRAISLSLREYFR